MRFTTRTKSSSSWPDVSIRRLSFNNEEDQKAFAAWQAEQARCSAKENQDVPDGERPAIHTQLFSSGVRPEGRTLFILEIQFQIKGLVLEIHTFKTKIKYRDAESQYHKNRIDCMKR